MVSCCNHFNGVTVVLLFFCLPKIPGLSNLFKYLQFSIARVFCGSLRLSSVSSVELFVGWQILRNQFFNWIFSHNPLVGFILALVEGISFKISLCLYPLEHDFRFCTFFLVISGGNIYQRLFTARDYHFALMIWYVSKTVHTLKGLILYSSKISLNYFMMILF